MKKSIVFIILVVIITIGDITAQSYKVIVNNNNKTVSISKKELAMVFLKKKKKWKNGESIAPVDHQYRAEVRATFSEEIFGKKVSAVRSYWQSAMFSGMVSAPIEKMSDQEIINYIKKNKGAIGYISSTTNVSGVKVVSID